jgi:hypothetical protein
VAFTRAQVESLARDLVEAWTDAPSPVDVEAIFLDAAGPD